MFIPSVSYKSNYTCELEQTRKGYIFLQILLRVGNTAAHLAGVHGGRWEEGRRGWIKKFIKSILQKANKFFFNLHVRYKKCHIFCPPPMTMCTKLYNREELGTVFLYACIDYFCVGSVSE